MQQPYTPNAPNPYQARPAMPPTAMNGYQHAAPPAPAAPPASLSSPYGGNSIQGTPPIQPSQQQQYYQQQYYQQPSYPSQQSYAPPPPPPPPMQSAIQPQQQYPSAPQQQPQSYYAPPSASQPPRPQQPPQFPQPSPPQHFQPQPQFQPQSQPIQQTYPPAPVSQQAQSPHTYPQAASPSQPYAPPSTTSPTQQQSRTHYQQQQATMASTAPKISAAQMPNIVAVQEADAERFSRERPFRTSTLTESLPPLPTTPAPIVEDDGCNPRRMRMTMWQLPTSEDLCQTARIPLAMIIQPFARSQSHEQAVPLVDFGTEGPIRCTRCRAYINLFCRFVSGGRSYECNICGMANRVSEAYFCHLDASGRRVDLATRPELRAATVDMVASGEYELRPPTAPRILFALDASRAALQSGAFLAALHAIGAFVRRQTAGPRTCSRMAIITFDRAIHVYDLRAAEPQVLVMSDVHEPFVPLHDGLFFDPIEAAAPLTALLERLPTLFAETRIVDSVLGAAALLAVEALQTHGGRVLLFATTLPSLGSGALRNRDSSTAPPSDKVNPLLLPQGDFYTKLANRAAPLGVSFTLVSTPASFLDLATLSQLCTLTSGHLLHYPKFALDTAGRQLIADVDRQLAKPFVYDAVARVRSGSGLQTAEYLGNCTSINQADYYFASMDCDQSFAVIFLYDSKLAEGERVSFQCAVLHTTSHGQRRIRILNLALPVTSLIASIFRMADLDAYLQLACKRAIAQLTTTALPALINQFLIRSAQLLAAYRKSCASSMPSGQLVLPDSFKLLPLYSLCLSKCPTFAAAPTHVDTRIALLRSLMDVSLSMLPLYLYPRMIPLHRLLEGDFAYKLDDMANALSHPEGESPLNGGGDSGPSSIEPLSILPPLVRLSQEFIEPHGVYLLDTGLKLIIWIGSMADPELLSRLFGVAQMATISPSLDALPELDNPLSSKTRHLLRMLQAQRSSNLPLQIIRQAIDPAESDWMSQLVEDGHPLLGPSYVDFLCRLHNQINHEMSASSLAERTALLSFLQ